MKISLKKSLIIFLLSLFTVYCLFLTFNFTFDNSVNAYAEERGDSHAEMSADKQTVIAGETVTFTVTLTTTRTDKQWLAVSLNLTPLQEDLLLKDVSVYPYLSLESHSCITGDTVSSGMIRDKFGLESNPLGVMLGYASPLDASIPIVYVVEIRIAKEIPVDSLTFGFATTKAELVQFTDRSEDRVKPNNGSGKLTYNPVTIDIEHRGDSHVEISADKQTVAAGGTVTFTLEVTTTRADTVWNVLQLSLAPVKEPNEKGKRTVDVTQCAYLSVESIQVNSEFSKYVNYCQDRFDYERWKGSVGAMCALMASTDESLLVSADVPVVFTVKIRIAKEIEADSLTFGFAQVTMNAVIFGRSMDIHDNCNGSRDGLITYNPVVIEIEH